MNPLPSFADFFRAVWGKDPFPWQAILAERVAAAHYRDGFPDAVDLPTASGKTACLDIAVYTLAAQADALPEKRTAARRVWFVVDRRIVVDEAFERAEKLAETLENPTGPALHAIAERLLKLRGLASKKRPLAVGRLRGGVLRDDGWARIPSQPAIITSTVDQLGSRLLFRGYGHSALAAPVFAGLAGNDSLILLDEAHCAVPFLQTLRAVKMFRSAKWSEELNSTPFHVAVLSATPPGQADGEKPVVFPANEEERTEALNHPVLQARLTASKRAVLKSVKSEDKLAEEIAGAAEKLARAGTMRVGVIVNRVARAADIAALLSEKANEGFDVELLTGRIRPVERDTVVEKLHPLLHSSSTAELTRPLILVSTQCLEVGADFSFDALVTECASLDALRQRFGRLARLGKPEQSEAFIFAAESALKDGDPIYGDALKATWEFLWNPSPTGIAIVENADTQQERRSVDFGFEALRAMLPPPDELKKLLAPTSDAPILLPAHLDLLCQTSPLPHPDPDIGIFLHGKGRKSAEVRVAFRCDFHPEHPEDWAEITSLCRPVSGEMFSVPLHRLRAWLRQQDARDTTGDVEGENDNDKATGSNRARTEFLIHRGREKSSVSNDSEAIYPNSTILLPAPRDADGVKAMRLLGQALCEQGLGSQRADLWELALLKSGKPAALRLHRECLIPWLGENGCPALKTFFDFIESSEHSQREMEAELKEAIQPALDWAPADDATPALPNWIREFLQAKPTILSRHPGGGLLLRAKSAGQNRDETDYLADEEYFSDDTDAASDAPEDAPLKAHCDQVARAAAAFARSCLGEETAVIAKAAGQWHDTGKLDTRFQKMLRCGIPDDGTPPLAKSHRKPRSKEQAKAIAESAGLPPHFRHEMLSAQLAEAFCKTGLSANDRGLLLHLIASHHGHARPFAPVCEDVAPPGVNLTATDLSGELSTTERAALTPPHRLDSGIADRFWQLTRRFGWWGLAHREAILRLADWYASEHAEKPPQP